MKLESAFEGLLWRVRWIIIVAVISSMILSIFIFYLSTLEVYNTIVNYFTTYSSSLTLEAKNDIKTDLISSIVKIIDFYLLGIFVLIFSLGLYELFISKIDEAEKSDFANRILLIKSFDDLKLRLGNIVLLILVVKFFQQAIEFNYNDGLNLLFLAIGILLISGALYISFARHK